MVYDLIASHGDVEDLVFFAVLMQGTTIGIKHVSYALTSAGPEGGVETRAFKTRVLTTLRCLADVNVSENHV